MFGYDRLLSQSLITFQSRREGSSGVQPPPLQSVNIAFLSFGKSHAKSDRLPTNTFTLFFKRHGLNVVFDDRGVIEDSLFHAESLQNPKHCKSSIHVQLLHTKPRDEDWFRQWGINE
jgi:hypothetical protein